MLSSNIMSYGIGDWNGHGFITKEQKARSFCYFNQNPYLYKMMKTTSKNKPTMTVEDCFKKSKAATLKSGSAAAHLPNSIWNSIPRGCSTFGSVAYLNYDFDQKLWYDHEGLQVTRWERINERIIKIYYLQSKEEEESHSTEFQKPLANIPPLNSPLNHNPPNQIELTLGKSNTWLFLTLYKLNVSFWYEYS